MRIPVLATLRTLVEYERARAADRRAYIPRPVQKPDGPTRASALNDLNAMTRQAERALRAARRTVSPDQRAALDTALTACRMAFGEAAHRVREEIENG